MQTFQHAEGGEGEAVQDLEAASEEAVPNADDSGEGVRVEEQRPEPLVSPRVDNLPGLQLAALVAVLHLLWSGLEEMMGGNR
jgi:hypothetical protein